MKNLFSFSIFQKLLITMLLVALVPLSAIWYVDYQNTTQQIAASVDQQLSDTSDKLTAQVDSWVNTNLKAMRQNAALPEIVAMDGKKHYPILKSMLDEYAWSYLVFTIGLDGKNVGRSDEKALIDYSDRIYVKQVLEGKPHGEQVLIGATSKKPALVMAVPVVNNDPTAANKGTVGIFAMASNLTDVSDVVAKSRIGRTGYAFLLEKDGKIVAHQKEEYVNKMADFSQHPAFLARPEKGKKQISYEEGGKKIIAYVQTTQQGWTMVTQQDHAEAYVPIQEANRNALILLALTLIVVTAIAYFFSQRLSRPIRDLTRIADEMSRGRVVPRMKEAERRDEIGNLARAIDRMGTSIRLAMDRLTVKKTA